MPQQPIQSERAAPRGGRRTHAALRGTCPLLAALAGLSVGCVIARAPDFRVARVIGSTALVRVEQADLEFLARVDTGADTTSIHALDLEIEDPSPRIEGNVGKAIGFRVVNERGEAVRLASVIAGVVELYDWHGLELRYAVPLELCWQGVCKSVPVSLRDRTVMQHKLLIGRDWLAGSFLVDVGRSAER
ncbi:MAG: RimK/LysX family protein [Myxococcales bacterium]|nr:RimK/LysX family protein [Myxococcales bacterium]MDH5307337.1 RimK/LysX family protein [Myxococcales bacterium]